ncbi:Kinesin-like protein KIN-8A [Stylosanthes scabra]|uniref:Kinesin-like protein n=1 Tax=Stylosanthes scabra TaxID=79078 RepID=A0ABU6X4N6_9FABA|nr:Kinesin-like protein KIN-8A [Stylosanthes scabra]
MPVSTRSQMTPNPVRDEPDSRLRNPHHGLKEKLRALTMLYEQQKQASQALKNPNQRFQTEQINKEEQEQSKTESRIMRENKMHNLLPNSTVTRTFVLPQPLPPPPPSSRAANDDTKENLSVLGTDRIVGFSCQRKATTTKNSATVSDSGSNTVARKLSMGASTAAAAAEESSEKQGKVVGNGSRILVFVRLRPMNKKEKEAGSRCSVRVVNRRDVYLTEFANENDYLRLNRVRGRHFTFDAAFPESASQQEVYSTTTSELVEAVLQGRNGSVFCYGATGAGKTYTMLGSVENPGVMVLAIKDLFSKIRQRSCDGNHVVHLSYLEVYNETVRDLLSPGRPLVLREDKQGIVAAGLTQYRAYSTDEVMALLQQGNQNRTTEPTRANETSSRSHAILQVVIEYRVRDAAMNIVNRVGKLSLIDLAGSERALATDQRTLRSLEGANINRSLLALSSCINALVEGKKHIPYRNSKLTQLLKDSLGGTCNTVMIANISPSNLSFGETQNTVHWADRAKEIRTKVSDANEDQLPVPETETDQAKLVLELQKENRELRMQLAKQQQKLLTVQAQSLAAQSSPTPPSASALSTPPTSTQPNEKRRTRSSFLSGTCFTPESNKKKGAELAVRTLNRTVKALEAEIERMKKDHSLQLKQKDDLIRELSRKGGIQAKAATTAEEVRKRVVTRASLRPKEPSNGELKSPNHRFRSPVQVAKKRSFWDIATSSSPSIATLNGRKTRSHVIPEPTTAPPPSMLLQPGFARQKANI